MITKSQVVECLAHTDLGSLLDYKGHGRKPRVRSIYELGDIRGNGTGRFMIDYASFNGGITEEVPLKLIRELEGEGIIVRVTPTLNMWRLKEK